MLSAEPWLEQKRRRARPTVSESEEVGADYSAPEEAFQSCEHTHVGCQLQTVLQTPPRLPRSVPRTSICPLFLSFVSSFLCLFTYPRCLSPEASSLFVLLFLPIYRSPTLFLPPAPPPHTHRNDSTLSLKERTFHLLHTLALLSLMNASLHVFIRRKELFIIKPKRVYTQCGHPDRGARIKFLFV